jgi:hypothetical protein
VRACVRSACAGGRVGRVPLYLARAVRRAGSAKLRGCGERGAEALPRQHTQHKQKTRTRHARTRHAPCVAYGDVRVRVARVAPPLLARLRRKALRRVGHQVVDAVPQKRNGHVGPKVRGKLRARGGVGRKRASSERKKEGLRVRCCVATCVWVCGAAGRVPRRRSRGGGPWAA